ncbi:TetR/AcrR family transcriptional regulator [Kutzneria sp. CA-103260]|uniref:TetR/AcrR family transcriptional regulator n=1 Tax=Kutzneria sp. CA-103260 TaxID=2802641 RepID=UPI001BAD4EEA|nr:TetR/AcrR family transcriptional regulator [Kutzneria sp. CA-103260]QUQ63781.1 transcriptional regulator [Kutzneria sp. CA-103260]
MAERGYRSPVREKHAEDTRRTIVEAAAALFAERGYGRTSVAAVAAAAGVAVNTVYTSVGGKPALLIALAEDGIADEIAVEMDGRVAASTDPREIIGLVADATGRVRRRRQQTLAVLLDNRDADPNVAAAADVAVKGIRDRLAVVAARLVEVGGLREGLSRKKVEQILWFFFGIEAWRTARGFGWSWSEAGSWLAEQAGRALLP